MTHRLLAAVVLAIAFAVGLGVVHVKLQPENLGRRTGGPLACEACGRSATAAPATLGQPVSMGPLTLRNQGGRTVTLERVELLDVDPGLDVIDTLVVEPDGRHPLIGGVHGFPPPEPGGPIHAVRGYALAPAQSDADFVQILFGLRLGSPGRAGARRIAVDYRAGDVPYRAYFDHSVWLCTHRVDREKGCIDPSW